MRNKGIIRERRTSSEAIVVEVGVEEILDLADGVVEGRREALGDLHAEMPLIVTRIDIFSL